MKQTLTVKRKDIKIHPLKQVVNIQTGTPPKRRETEALAALLKKFKEN